MQKYTAKQLILIICVYTIIAFLLSVLVFKKLEFFYYSLIPFFISIAVIYFSGNKNSNTMARSFSENNLSAAKIEKQEITIMFCDINPLTVISYNKSPEEVIEYLNHYLSVMTELIIANNGTIDRFTGDTIVAYFGHPPGSNNHALDAVKAAIEMVAAARTIKIDDSNLNISIGINTGITCLGYIGPEKFQQYTIIGDSVNLTSRIQNLNRQYNTNVLISNATNELIKESIETLFVDSFNIKGKEENLCVYEVREKSN